MVCGGVTLAGDHLFVPLRREVARRAFKPAVAACRIVPGELAGHRGRLRRGEGVHRWSSGVPKVGILGSLVWDLIHGRDPASRRRSRSGAGSPTRSPASTRASRTDWEIVPLIKVGRDLAAQAQEFLRGLEHLAPGARCVEVPAPNNRVVLHYHSSERRCERMSGGVPGWTWAELGPMVRDLDAIYVNFISGFELSLGTAQALRQGFHGPIYADLHSLFLGMQHDGMRVLQPLPEAASWFGCFDVVQLNEDEMRQLSPDPLSLAAEAIGEGVSLLVVTLSAKGSAYVAAPGFDRLADGGGRARLPSRRAVPPPPPCGPPSSRRPASRRSTPPAAATCSARRRPRGSSRATRWKTPCGTRNAMAARNAAFRGAGGLCAVTSAASW